MAATDPNPPSTTSGSPDTGRPWQVAVAVMLLAVWWVGTYTALIFLFGGELDGDDLYPLLGVGLWTIVIFFVLRNVWRGGRSTPHVALIALLLGTLSEITGLLTLLLWFLPGSFLPLWGSLLLIVVGACPLSASSLLTSRAVQAYAADAYAKVDQRFLHENRFRTLWRFLREDRR